VHWEPPQPGLGSEDLLPISTAANVELALGSFLALEILDSGVVFQHELRVELDEVGKRAKQQHGEAKRHTYNNTRDAIQGFVAKVLVLCEFNETVVQLRDCENDHDGQTQIHITQQLDKELPVIEANTIVDPWAMVVHVQDAAVTDAAMMCTVGLPYVAHLAISSTFCLIAHVEAPIRRH